MSSHVCKLCPPFAPENARLPSSGLPDVPVYCITLKHTVCYFTYLSPAAFFLFPITAMPASTLPLRKSNTPHGNRSIPSSPVFGAFTALSLPVSVEVAVLLPVSPVFVLPPFPVFVLPPFPFCATVTSKFVLHSPSLKSTVSVCVPTESALR